MWDSVVAADSEFHWSVWNEETNCAVRYAGACCDVTGTFNFADGSCLPSPRQVPAAHYVLCGTPGFVRFCFIVTLAESQARKVETKRKWKLRRNVSQTQQKINGRISMMSLRELTTRLLLKRPCLSDLISDGMFKLCVLNFCNISNIIDPVVIRVCSWLNKWEQKTLCVSPLQRQFALRSLLNCGRT